MGQLIKGRWVDSDERPTDASGAFIRSSSVFRNWVTNDGAAGATGASGFRAERGRYHLFVAPSCPWAHRTIIFRRLKGLEDIVSMSLTDAPKTEGWSYSHGFEHLRPRADGVFRLHQVYTDANPSYTGKATVPVLWDREQKTIVSNESSEIIRMFNRAFDQVGALPDDFCPSDLLAEIDHVNAYVYENLNNGVYRAGFAKTQKAHEQAVSKVFAGLDWLEARLERHRYLTGDRVTEADWRAFPTLLRFDLVYFGLFKCNFRRVMDYPNLSDYVRELFQWPHISETCDFNAIKVGYYATMPHLNPNKIVPAGPDLKWLYEPCRHFERYQSSIHMGRPDASY